MGAGHARGIELTGITKLLAKRFEQLRVACVAHGPLAEQAFADLLFVGNDDVLVSSIPGDARERLRDGGLVTFQHLRDKPAIENEAALTPFSELVRIALARIRLRSAAT